jgi:hypothetical protein
MGNTLTALNLSCSVASVVTRDLALRQGLSWATVSWMASGKFLPLALAGPCFPRSLRDQTSREDSLILEEVSLVQKVTENLLCTEKKMTR